MYWSTELATNWDDRQVNGWKIRLVYLLFFFIPKSNPDNEKLYPLVRQWLLETDSKGIAIREIALDKDGKILFSAPNDRNVGFWTDSREPLPQNQLIPVEASIFEQHWREAVSRLGY